MKQLAGSIRIGWVIEYKGKPWTVTKAQHIKPGKGGAFMQVEMKAVEEGAKTVAACLAIVESANTGKIVKPDYSFW